MKPQHPLPPLLRRVFRKLLPNRVYRRYVGRHEDTSLAYWKKIASATLPDAAILDIGAYFGEFSLAAREASGNARIFAFEPNPDNVRVLRRALHDRNISVEPFAVSDCNGTVSFACDAAQGSILDRTPLVASNATSAVPIQEVPCVSLDVWTAERCVKPILIKIDVEGGEAAVLRGAKRLLEDSSPTILCEVLSDEAGQNVMRELPPTYVFFHIDENSGILEQRETITRRLWRNKNWLLTPRSSLADFA